MDEIGRTPHKIVLTDLRMPNGSGIDVLRAALRCENRPANVPQQYANQALQCTVCSACTDIFSERFCKY